MINSSYDHCSCIYGDTIMSLIEQVVGFRIDSPDYDSCGWVGMVLLLMMLILLLLKLVCIVDCC